MEYRALAQEGQLAPSLVPSWISLAGYLVLHVRQMQLMRSGSRWAPLGCVPVRIDEGMRDGDWVDV